MPSPSISVLICAYTEERWGDLVAAVDSVRRQTLLPLEIIVVIDHNPALLARAQASLPATVIANTDERGLSGARNTGIAVARGDVIAFMDEDAVAEPDWLRRLAAGYADPDVIGVGGAIVPRWLAGQPAWFPDEFNWVVGCTYRGLPETTAPIRNLIGCNMSLRREVFSAVGLFRNGMGRIGVIPLGCEETELCIRASQHWRGGRFLYEPGARVHHAVPARRGTVTYFRSRCYAEGLSKAQVARFVGAGDGLASERSYTLRTLPAGVLRGLADTIRRGEVGGLGRAAAIAGGLALTATGYGVGTLRQWWIERRQGGSRVDLAGADAGL